MKENGKRIKFWGTVCLITILLTIGGFISYNNGYGLKGRAKVKLTPISESFNKLDSVIRFGDLTSKVSGTKIVVTLINPNNSKEKFYYELKEEENYSYIESEYNDTNALFIAKQMVDAVYKKDGASNSMYDYYDFESFKDSTVKDGVYLTDKKILINITDNIFVGLKGKITPKNRDLVFDENEITQIMNDLKNQKKSSKEIDGIKLYITEEETTYTAYITFNEDVKERSLISLANIVKALNKTTYDTIEINNDLPVFKEDSILYSIDTNAKLETVSYFSSDDIICKLVINK